MYFKLVVRSLWRHQKRGRKLFVLLALCSAALIALLAFQTNFETQYRNLFIGLKTGHLQVLPASSPVFSTSFGARSQETPLFNADGLDAWVSAQPEVDRGAPFINRSGVAYNLDSESESWLSLVALPADRLTAVFPLARLLEGEGNLAWKNGEVPVLRSRLQNEFGQKNADHTKFDRREFKPKSLEALKTKVIADFPALFADKDFRGPEKDDAFLTAWAAALTSHDLAADLPPARLEDYDYRIDDALTALKENTVDAMLPFLNKRVFQALYPDELTFVAQPIVVGKSVTLQVPSLRNEGALSLPKIIPARYVGMVDIMPLYVPDSFVDLEAFRHFMGVEPSLATGYVIRLRNIADTPAFAAKLEAWIAQNAAGDGLRVADYQFLGKIYLTTSTAFVVIIGILIVVFILIVGLFILNLVLLSLVQRRAEIGTGIALGLTNGQTIAVFLGEIGVLVTVSWLVGCLVACGLIAAAAAWGVPGMIFFPGQVLKFAPEAGSFLKSYLLMLPAALLAALIPLMGLRSRMPVEYFREAR